VAPDALGAGSEVEPEAKASGYKVVAPLVAVRVGAQVLQYSVGDILPDGVDKNTLARLTNLGFLAEA
jgi:hypothetical protein